MYRGKHRSSNTIPTYEERKLFIGGLNLETNKDSLRNYFGTYGEIIYCVVKENHQTRESRGFGFVEFKDRKCAEKVLNAAPHIIDGRKVRCAWAKERDGQDNRQEGYRGHRGHGQDMMGSSHENDRGWNQGPPPHRHPMNNMGFQPRGPKWNQQHQPPPGQQEGWGRQPPGASPGQQANPKAMTGGARPKENTGRVAEEVKRLHEQLEACPNSSTEMEDPKDLKVTLEPHQRQALTWLIWRETQVPSGGILADDMGLGKTLTMISLVLKQKQLKPKEEKNDRGGREKQIVKDIMSRATLIICPASLIDHWLMEIEERVKKDKLQVLKYHGRSRPKKVEKLADTDIVLTSYSLVGIEVGRVNAIAESKDDKKNLKDGGAESEEADDVLLRIVWKRIILDEAHCIKNRDSKWAKTCCQLRAQCRWAVTGTPVQNAYADIHSLFKFLGYFDQCQAEGITQLSVILKSVMLRRLKSQKNSDGNPLVSLPKKTVFVHTVELSQDERKVYDMLASKSSSMMTDYLNKGKNRKVGRTTGHQPHMNKLTDHTEGGTPGSSHGTVLPGKDTERSMGHKKLLVMLLRLRQCCCHLSLMKEAIDEETAATEGLEVDTKAFDKETAATEGLEVDIVEQMQNINVSNNISKEFKSSKVKAVMDKLSSIRKKKKKEKSVVVSQWTKMLEVLAHHLSEAGIKWKIIQGSVSEKNRARAVTEFNKDVDGPEVLLVSLKAGGVGLNLIGGNHCFLIDQHWNPSLEDQACDRIYRMGQTKDVFIHRFICQNTIEESVVKIQQEKRKLTESVLTGYEEVSSELTLDDLKLLFRV